MTAPITTPSVVAPVTPVTPLAPLVPVNPSAPVAPLGVMAPAPTTAIRSKEDVIAAMTRGESVAADPLLSPTLDLDGKPRIDPSEIPAVTPDAAAVQTNLEQGFDAGTGDSLFRIRGADGQFKSTPSSHDDKIEVAIRMPDGTVKSYDKTMPELVRMARDGVAGQRHAQELAALKPQYDAKMAEVTASLNAQIALNRSILEDENEYVRRAQQYAEQSSPEVQLAELTKRVQQSEEQNRRASESARLTQEMTAFHTQSVEPDVNRALQANIPLRDVVGEIALNTDHLKGPDGRIPKEHWAAYATYLQGPFRTWAAQEAARYTTAPVSAAPIVPTGQPARIDPAMLANIGRGLAPPTVATLPGDATRALPPAKTKDEAMQRIINRQR
jgi:hypothetical protein